MLHTEGRNLGVNGTPPWLVPMEDAAERRALADENARLRARLAHAEKLASAGTMLAGIAHELNNPLTVILGLADLIGVETGKADSRIEKICTEAERGARIVHNLLHLCRADGGGAIGGNDRIDLHAEIREGVELAACSIPGKGIGVRLLLPKETPRAIGRPGAIVQTLLNLVTNAAQAIQDVQLSGSIAVSSVVEGGRARIVVRDNGPGIPATMLARVFDPFFTTKASGNGLGLNLCRQMIEDMGGTIAASNAEGGGAVFTIDLPLATASETAAARVAYAGPPAGCKTEEPTVLVVDDEEQIVDLVEAFLRRRGFRTHRIGGSSGNAEGAIEALREGNYDLVISDFHMPGDGGRKLLEWLQSSGKPTKAIVVSGDVFTPDTREFVENAGAVFLAKPFSLPELLAAVDRVMMPPGKPC